MVVCIYVDRGVVINQRLSTTLKEPSISNFLQLIITTAFIPFIALVLDIC